MNINIRSSRGNYKVIEFDFSKFLFSKTSNKFFYIIDLNVYKKNKYLKKIKNNLVIIRANENTKDYKNISQIIGKLLNLQIKRDSILIGIGGGITQDITGFIASIIFRGIRWDFIPTTVLAQCDSCIGGKTSINFEKTKNQLGNFYPPRKIYLDVNFLKTLKFNEIKSGLGEMSHYFLVSGLKDWNLFKKNLNHLLKKNLNKKLLKKMIFKSLLIKKNFIEIDEFDTGKRLILNYGHSFGHALEKITNYQIPHGLAVAHGINISNFISLKKKYIKFDTYKDIEIEMAKIVKLKKIKKINLKHFLEILKKDKKNKKGEIKVILTKGYGKMFLKGFKKKFEIFSILKKYKNYI